MSTTSQELEFYNQVTGLEMSQVCSLKKKKKNLRSKLVEHSRDTTG